MYNKAENRKKEKEKKKKLTENLKTSARTSN